LAIGTGIIPRYYPGSGDGDSNVVRVHWRTRQDSGKGDNDPDYKDAPQGLYCGRFSMSADHRGSDTEPATDRYKRSGIAIEGAAHA